MSEAREHLFTFRCGECGESIEVDAPMREAMMDKGCVICGAAVPDSSFEDASPGAPS